MLLPRPGKSDCCYMGWLRSSVPEKDSDKPLRASAGTTGHTECGAVVSQHESVHATKKLCTNICIILMLLYPKTLLLFFPYASQCCLILI